MIIAQTTTTDDDLFGGVNDFFDSGAWLVIRNLTIFFVVVFWLATAYWVYKDARRRVEDPWLVAMATVLGLIPPFVVQTGQTRNEASTSARQTGQWSSRAASRSSIAWISSSRSRTSSRYSGGRKKR